MPTDDPTDPPLPLDYRPPDKVAGPSPAAGFLLTIVWVFLSVPVALLVSYAHQSGRALLVALAIAMALLGAVVATTYRETRSRPFLAGALLGFGVAALTEGVCFVQSQ